MARYIGKLTVDVDGIGVLPTVGDTEIQTAGFDRTAVVGDTGVLGYEHKNTTSPTIKCKVRFSNSLKPSQIEKIVSASITITGDNGFSLVASEAWCAKEITIKGGDSSDVEFQAVRIDEV